MKIKPISLDIIGLKHYDGIKRLMSGEKGLKFRD